MHKSYPQLLIVLLLVIAAAPSASFGAQDFSHKYVCKGSRTAGRIGYSTPWNDRGYIELWANFISPSKDEIEMSHRDHNDGGVIEGPNYNIIVLPIELDKFDRQRFPVLLDLLDGKLYKIISLDEVQIDLGLDVGPLSNKARKLYEKFSQTIAECTEN